MVHPIGKVNLWVVQSELESVTPKTNSRDQTMFFYTDGTIERQTGPWCTPIEKVTLWVVHGVPHREGYSMGGPWYAP